MKKILSLDPWKVCFVFLKHYNRKGLSNWQICKSLCLGLSEHIIFFHDSHDGLILEFLKERKNYITNKTLSQSYYSYILEGTLYKRNLKFYYKLIERVKWVNFFFFNRDLNRGWLAYMFSLRFSGSKFLINLLRQFRVRKIFRTQSFVGFTVFSFRV